MFIFRKVELINKYDFIKVVLDENSEIFVVYIVTLKVVASAGMTIHFFGLS